MNDFLSFHFFEPDPFEYNIMLSNAMLLFTFLLPTSYCVESTYISITQSTVSFFKQIWTDYLFGNSVLF